MERPKTKIFNTIHQFFLTNATKYKICPKFQFQIPRDYLMTKNIVSKFYISFIRTNKFFVGRKKNRLPLIDFKFLPPHFFRARAATEWKIKTSVPISLKTKMIIPLKFHQIDLTGQEHIGKV